MKKIYIAGKITGEVESPELMQKCKKKFHDYSLKIINNKTSCTHGFLINSYLISSGLGTWSQYLKNDISVMLTCDEVHFLPDWQDSNGARLEHHIAEKLGMVMVFVE